MKNKIKITNAVLLNSCGIGDILINDNKIEDIIPPDTDTPDYTVFDAGGNFVSPGFIDIHQHGGGGSDYMDSDDDAYFNITEAHLAHGTTSVMPTALSADSALTLRAVKKYKSALNDSRIRTNLLGLHLEGPYLSPAQSGAQNPDRIRSYNKDEYDLVIESADGLIKRWSTAPELDGVEDFANKCVKSGITLSIAHSNATFEETVKAFDLGFQHITHLYSCMSTITRKGGFRTAGVLEAAFYIDKMNVEVIADGCHVPDSLLNFTMKFKNKENIALITDSMRAAGQNVTKSFLGSLDDPTPVIIEDGVAKLLSKEAFAGSVATADRLVRTLVKAGADIEYAVRAVTENPLRQMNLSVNKGKLKKGYDADICVFDKDINIKAVFVAGRRCI